MRYIRAGRRKTSVNDILTPRAVRPFFISRQNEIIGESVYYSNYIIKFLFIIKFPKTFDDALFFFFHGIDHFLQLLFVLVIGWIAVIPSAILSPSSASVNAIKGAESAAF